ncbi:MAG: hypothetical protein WCW02_03360 [Candidatus Buchananbacteria bacterium]
MKKFKLAGLLIILGLIILPQLSLAAVDFNTQLNSLATSAGYDTSSAVSLTSTIGKIINYLLGFLGIIALLIVIWAGFNWMTAGGNDDKISSAKSWMVNGFIGLVIIIFAYAISTFVITQIQAFASK